MNPAGYTGSSLIWSYWVVSFCGLEPDACLLSLIKVLAFYLLSGFLLIPSFPTSVLVALNFLSLTIQSRHRFLQSFFVFEIEFDIDDESLVLESP